MTRNRSLKSTVPVRAPNILFKNGPAPTSLIYFWFFYWKIVDFIGIRTGIAGKEDEPADHLTTPRPQIPTILYGQVKE